MLDCWEIPGASALLEGPSGPPVVLPWADWAVWGQTASTEEDNDNWWAGAPRGADASVSCPAKNMSARGLGAWGRKHKKDKKDKKTKIKKGKKDKKDKTTKKKRSKAASNLREAASKGTAP